jgi:hypothetical protein
MMLCVWCARVMFTAYNPCCESPKERAVLILEEVVLSPKRRGLWWKVFEPEEDCLFLWEVKGNCSDNLRAIGARSVCIFE